VQGIGVDRIDVFLDDRDEGGTFLASALLADAPEGGPAGTWSVTVELPENMRGLHTLWFYAHSTMTGEEITHQIPVEVE
jgi:hypothetical protein